MVRRILQVWLVVGAIGLWASSCGESASDSGNLCEPGSEVFCKCRGGFEGTKTCSSDGSSLGECTTPDGPCPEIPDTTSSTTDGATTTTGAGGGTGGSKALYEACADGTECVSGTCDGFCTQTCVDFNDCTEDGDCIVYAGGQRCAPYCTSQDDCSAYDASVVCGGAVALDDATFNFGACAVWGADARGMPYGTLCDSTNGTILVFDSVVPGECHLGLSGVQNVCLFGECAQACYEDVDCPAEDCTATGGGAPGCCTSDPSCN